MLGEKYEKDKIKPVNVVVEIEIKLRQKLLMHSGEVTPKCLTKAANKRKRNGKKGN